jgi:undecaprenyl-diphosphatase
VATPGGERTRDGRQPPRPSFSLLLTGSSVLVITLSGWLAVRPGAQAAQTELVLWLNNPPQPVAVIFAVVNPLLRPVPLVVVSGLLLGWVLLAAPGGTERLEMLRALAVALVLAELVAQVVKRLADQPRPLSAIPGLDSHGYPTDPHGNAYPSAHTAMVVAAVSALWPWMRWPQRIVSLAFAALVALHRIYIGAHWPIDVVGGAAIGLLAGTVTWILATRWPIRR